MISNTIYSKGHNQFKNDIFSSREWSAPTMVSPEEIQKRIDRFNLCGRKIKRMKMIGLSYFHTCDWVEDEAYRQVEHLPEEERRRKSNYKTIDPTMQFDRCAEIDEPLLIEFEDGDAFEINTPQDPEFRMSMNCIPWWTDAGTNQPNAEANILLSPCIGQTIAAVEVHTYITDRDPMFRDAFDKPLYQRELVSDITLRFENGLGLQIGAHFDYCLIVCVDANGDTVQLPFSELKQALFNWEDLHNDETTGFEAESHTIFFGRKGREHVGDLYRMLSSSGCDSSCLYISIQDFLMLDWCISRTVKKQGDEYREHHFSYTEWLALLNEATRLLSIEKFDTLFDELVAGQKNRAYMLNKLNCRGASFWKDRAKYRTQIKDLREWTELVLKPGDTMGIYDI